MTLRSILTRILLIFLACFFLWGCGCTDLEKKIWAAALEGDHETVRSVLSQGVEPGMTCWCPEGGKMGATKSLIQAAVSSGSWETVQLLVEQKKNMDGALYFAIHSNNIPLARQLIDSGAQFYRYHSYSYIHRALSIDDLKSGERLFHFVMQLGADINRPSQAGETIVMYLFRERHHYSSSDPEYVAHKKKIFERNARMVFSRQPNLDLKPAGQTALMYAVCQGEKEDISLLLHHGANPDIQDRNGNTALMRALQCKRGDEAYVEIIDLFERYDANLDLPNNDGETCLMVAAQDCGPSTVRRLIALGAGVDARDTLRETALFKAVRGELNHVRKHTRLKEKARCVIIRQLAHCGADINTPNAAGLSPLAMARMKDFPTIADTLASLGGRDIRAVAKK